MTVYGYDAILDQDGYVEYLSDGDTWWTLWEHGKYGGYDRTTCPVSTIRKRLKSASILVLAYDRGGFPHKLFGAAGDSEG